MWLLDHQRKGVVQQPDRFGVQGLGVDRHPLDLSPAKFNRPDTQSSLYNGIREGHDLPFLGDGRAHHDDYHVYRGSHGIHDGHYDKGREYDVLPGTLRGEHQSSDRFEGYDPAQGVLRGMNTPFERANEVVEFGMARKMNRDSDMVLQMPDVHRDYQAVQLEFSRKRSRMDGEEDVQDPRDGRFFGTNMEGIDKRFLGKQSPHYHVSSEYQQIGQSLNQISGDRVAAFGREQMKRDDAISNKRQQVVSREEELLIEHGLLGDDSPDRKSDSPFKSESLSDDKALLKQSRQGFGFPLPGAGNIDDTRSPQRASKAKAFGQKPTKGEGTYYNNLLERGYPINPSEDTLRGSTCMEARDQIRDMPLHLHGSHKDLYQGRSVESGSFWHNASNDRNSVLSNERIGAHERRATFHATRDTSHMSVQQSAGVPILSGGDRVHRFDSSKAGGFEDHHFPEGGAIQKFSQLKPPYMRERQQDESLKTIEELHMDFVQQQQQKMHKQSYLQPGHSQEDRPDEGSNFLPQVHHKQLQAVNRNQLGAQGQGLKQSSQGRTSYDQMQQLQTSQFGEPNLIQDRAECKTRIGESMTNSYGDRLHQSNLQAQNQWSQTLQHSNSQSETSLKKNIYPSTSVHKHGRFQHPLPHHMVQEHTLPPNEQQQRMPHHPDQQMPKLHQDISQVQPNESQQMPNQVPKKFPLSQQNQLNLQQQHGPSQLPQQHIQSQEWHQLPSHQLIYEHQNPSEWGYQLQQEGKHETGPQYQLEVMALQQDQFNSLIQQFPKQPEQYRHLDQHQQQPQVEQGEQKSQHIFTAGGPEISLVTMHGSYDFRPDGSGVPPVMQASATMSRGKSLGQPPQASTVNPPIPPLAPPPLPPSPPSSPAHAPPPPPLPPASPPKSSASAGFSSAAAGTHSLPTSMRSFPDINPSTQGYQYPHAPRHHGAGFPVVGSQSMHHMPFKQFGDPGQQFPPKPAQEDRPKVVDAIHIFKQPGRTNRPDRFVVILRGLPGSGKSYLAKALRDIEVTSGGSAPRIHSMDDYFMAEVEKNEDNDTGNATSSLLRSKKRVTKKVMEYCYEPEMEEGYRASMLKAFKKTLEEGMFTFIIVDDRNLRVADFAQFWAVAKRSGYEVYLLEAPYKDTAGCAARNVHGFTADKVQEMAKSWEPAPPLYLQLDISALFRGDDLDAQDITEVEMDMDDTEHDVEEQGGLSRTESGKTDSTSEFSLQNGVVSHGDRWGSENLDARDEAKNLASSKWSDDHENNTDAEEDENADCNALSGLMQAYGKGDRCVRWADQGGKDSNKGFSIGSLPQNKHSLMIGPGPGYNEASNPLPEEDKSNLKYGSSSGGESKRKTKLFEQLRAEQETFRAVFDRRRHRIGGLDEDDE